MFGLYGVHYGKILLADTFFQGLQRQRQVYLPQQQNKCLWTKEYKGILEKQKWVKTLPLRLVRKMNNEGGFRKYISMRIQYFQIFIAIIKVYLKEVLKAKQNASSFYEI